MNRADDRSATRRETTPALRGQKVPQPHRLFLVDGRVLRGEVHRLPNSRLADHLSTLKGVVSVTNAECERTGERFPYIVVMLNSLVFIEECDPPSVYEE